MTESYPHLKKAPVALVLAQVRFPPLLKMADYIPELQDQLRKFGFAFFLEEAIHEFVLQPSGNAIQQTPRKHRWSFTNKNQNESVVVTEDFIVLETNKYDVFAVFLESLIKILDTFIEVTKLEVFERVGLRFFNLLKDEENLSALNQLKPGLRGINNEESNYIIEQRCSTITQAETKLKVENSAKGNLVIRTTQIKYNANFLPPDLSSTKLSFRYSIKENDPLIALDIDHYVHLVDNFESNILKIIFSELHVGNEVGFRNSVTAEALNEWKN